MQYLTEYLAGAMNVDVKHIENTLGGGDRVGRFSKNKCTYTHCRCSVPKHYKKH